MTVFHETIMLCYFSFTSLCTVGFGDYSPKSDVERVFFTVILLMGVGAFSFILSELLAILEKFNKRDEDISEAL